MPVVRILIVAAVATYLCASPAQAQAPSPTVSAAAPAAAPAPTQPATYDATARALAIRDLASPDLGRRSAAILRLGTLGRPEDLTRIAAFLDGADPALRTTAARMLLGAGDPAAMERFTKRAGDPQAPVRLEALVVLREVPALSPAARRAAERALGDADVALRSAALELLTAHPAADSVPMVAGALTDSNREIRLLAVRFLGLCRDKRALLPLLDRIDAQDRTERVAVIDAIAAIGAHPPLDPGPAVLRQLDDTNEEVRRAAVDALGRLRHAGAVPALRQLAHRPARDLLARRAVLALGNVGGDAAVQALIPLLREAAPLDEVGVALRRTGASAVAPTAAVLADGFSSSVRMAADVLAALGDRAATPALAAALTARPLVAISVARALGALRDPAGVPALMTALRDARYAAAPGAREACLRALASLVPFVSAAAIATAAGGDVRLAGVVNAAARDADADVREAGLQLAALVGSGLSRETLVAALRDPDTLVRRAAIAAAVALPALDPAPLLMGLTTAEERRIVQDAADALESIAQTADRPRLTEALARTPASGKAPLQRALDAVARRQAGVTWVRVRLLAPDGSPAPRREVAVAPARTARPAGALAPKSTWVRGRTGRTGDDGEVLLTGLPGAGPYVLSVDSALVQVARTEATASGKSPAITPELPRASDASVPARP